MSDVAALHDLLNDRAFVRPTLEMLVNPDQGTRGAINIAIVYLVRHRVPRDRAELHATAYVLGLIRGLAIGGGKEAIE